MLDPIFEIKKEKETADYGLFYFEPLAQGFGQTLGTALRRVLLSSLRGAAVTRVKITGVKHQFSTLEGLKEDMIEFILNLKQLRIKYNGDKAVKLSLDVSGPGEVKAGDIDAPAEVVIVNPELVLANLADKNAKLKAEIWVECGYGYSPADERSSDKLGEIMVDAAFSPVRRVNPQVESTRVGRRTDFDRLILEIVTDGTIKPSEAVKSAANTLLDYFQQIIKPKKAPKEEVVETTSLSSVTSDLTVEELDLPTRIANALRKGGYGTLNDLVNAARADLAKVKNLGEKSVKIVEAAMATRGAVIKD